MEGWRGVFCFRRLVSGFVNAVVVSLLVDGPDLFFLRGLLRFVAVVDWCDWFGVSVGMGLNSVALGLSMVVDTKRKR